MLKWVELAWAENSDELKRKLAAVSYSKASKLLKPLLDEFGY